MLRVVIIDIDIDKRSKQRSYPINVLGKTQRPMSAVVVSPEDSSVVCIFFKDRASLCEKLGAAH